MKFYQPIHLSQIITSIASFSHTIVGDSDIQIAGIDDYRVVLPKEMTWVDFPPYYDEAFSSPATAILIDSLPSNYPHDKVLIVVKDPKATFDHIAKVFYESQFPPRTFWQKIINPKNVSHGKNCNIHSSASIGRNVYIGNNVTIGPHVTIYDNVYIGDNSTIHAGCVIGAQPFSHVQLPNEEWEPRNAWGNVIIMNDVDILALSTVERGITSSTIIGSGTKTGCQILISHDVWIGRNCYLCGGISVGGYARVKDCCTLWGRAGIANSVQVADHTTLQSCSVIYQNVKHPGLTYAGIPAVESEKYWEQRAIENIMIKEYAARE